MRNRWITAALIALVGLVWIGQGTGFIRGTGFMTDNPFWAIVGAILVVVAAIVGLTGLRARPRA